MLVFNLGFEYICNKLKIYDIEDSTPSGFTYP